ncbi:hypothetical protein ACP70R_007121 [Stipagrostis hirtigluma subsp. patula]
MRAGWAKKGDMGYKGARLGCQVRRSPRIEARRRRRWVAIDVMLLRRVLGSLLTSRFSPRRSSLRAPVGRPEAPARRLHTLRSLAGDGGGARGAVAVAASAGLIGTLYLCTYTDDPAGEVPGKGPEQTAASAKKPNSDDADEATGGGESMEARFERWMTKVGRTYDDEEEKARRFEAFKATVESIESHPRNRRSGRRVCPNGYADWTRDEARALLRYGNGIMSEEECFERMKSVPGFKKQRMTEAAAIRAQMESHMKEVNSKACSGD